MHTQDRATRRIGGARLALALLLGATSLPAAAAPWLPVGDRVLRNDVEILAAHGLIDHLVMSWPIPKGQFEQLRDNPALEQQLAEKPEYVRRAAQRVLAYLDAGEVTRVASLRVTNAPAVVRDFGTSARNEVDARLGVDYESGNFAASVRVGGMTDVDGTDDADFLPDDSYISYKGWLGLRYYAGWVEQWYGPGAISSLMWSNNARPLPKIGFMRDNPKAFDTPLLHWLGPFQINGFLGYYDENRIDDNVMLGSLRFTINPLPGFEMSIMRSSQFCGDRNGQEVNGRTCNPFTAAFEVWNKDGDANETNDQANPVEMKYTHQFKNVAVSPYIQTMNEDTPPFVHSYSSHLFGLAFTGPWGLAGGSWNLTAEFTDSIATYAMFGFNRRIHGLAYSNTGYLDGFRYRGRSQGFSLDSDSQLGSLALMLVDSKGWNYRLVYHYVSISTEQLQAQENRPENTAFRNVVSRIPRQWNELNAGLSMPLGKLSLEMLVRVRDENPPADIGDQFEAELGMSYRF